MDDDATRIRKATGEDAEALAKLRFAFRSALASPSEPEDTFRSRAAAWMRDRLGSPAWHCWIAADETGVVGHVFVHEIEKIPNPVDEPEAMAYITNVYVKPDRRAGGIGARLLEAALDWCRARGVESALLRPTERSRTLYERHGFRTASGLMELHFEGAAGATASTPRP